MGILEVMTTSEWDFSGYKTLKDARNFFRGKISDKWDLTRTETDAGVIKKLERDAKDTSREWRRFVETSELNIDSKEGKLADYEKVACVLGTVKAKDRKADHEPLWIAVDHFVKGWKDFNGNWKDQERFSRLSDYENFIRAMGDYGKFYSDVLNKAGIK